MVTQDLGTAAIVADVLNELAMKADSVAQKQRDPSIPAGAVLAESDFEGALHREVKTNSMVRLGKTPLPERFQAWDIYGNQSMLPTAQMARMLSKPNAERPDLRAFHVHASGVTRAECSICPPSVTPYEGTCQWCMARAQVQKRFDSEAAHEAHNEYYHPREWSTLQRQLEREARAAELQTQKDLANAMMAMARTQATPVAEPAVAAAPVEAPVVEMVDCPDCGKTVRTAGLAFHKRRWCKGSEAIDGTP